jgi:hypothetical protein
LFAATSDGYLFCYNLETVAGNECALVRQFRIGPTYGDEQSGSAVPLGTTTVGASSSRPAAASQQAKLIDFDVSHFIRFPNLNSPSGSRSFF